jgi:hypothetical protein
MHAMRRFGDRNDWWDWGVILLVVVGGTILLWASVWLVHSHTPAPRGTSTSAVVGAPATQRGEAPQAMGAPQALAAV